jgi:hypothetical protein
MTSAEVLSTVRIGQLTGSKRVRDPKWENPVDPIGWPLLNDTGRWGVMGADLGANTEHADGRLYFFTGDVAVEWDPSPEFTGFSGEPLIINNSDLVAWTDDREILRHGGYLAQGWNFFLPNDYQGPRIPPARKIGGSVTNAAGCSGRPRARTVRRSSGTAIQKRRVCVLQAAITAGSARHSFCHI